MHIEFLLEEPSSEAALRNLVPKILRNGPSFECHVHQGKLDLVSSLTGRLRGYRPWIPDDWRIVVLIDADDDNCVALKQCLDSVAEDCGFTTKAAAYRHGSPRFAVLTRIAVEELEAWFFGDVQALAAAYPGVPPSLSAKAKYRDSDAIRGTWEALERVLQDAGHHLGGLGKITAARDISQNMNPDRNQSRSFIAFRDGLRALSI